MVEATGLRYGALIGTGGIGTGMFFALDGLSTLGREESRTGRFLERRDYCKLHIVSHYVARLLGSGFAVIPIGRVGADDAGDRLAGEMAAAGLDLRYVVRTTGSPTMFAVCLVYSDGSGGNLTTADSACARVDEALIMSAEAEFARFAGRGIAAALPEVPLAARRALLGLGTRYGLLRVASFNSAELRGLAEAGELGGHGWLASIDLLALNLDEAAALAGADISPERAAPAAVVDAAIAALAETPRPPMATITAGARGSWCFDGAGVRHLPAWPLRPVSTAGAGDAHLAGMLAGFAAGLSPAESHELAALTAAMSVMSPHTINPEIDRPALLRFGRELGRGLSAGVAGFLAGAMC